MLPAGPGWECASDSQGQAPLASVGPVLETLDERVDPSLGTHARGHPALRDTLRIAIYCQDSLGLGHLRRSTLIGQRLLQEAPTSAILLFADSPVAPFFALRDGMDCV